MKSHDNFEHKECKMYLWKINFKSGTNECFINNESRDAFVIHSLFMFIDWDVAIVQRY